MPSPARSWPWARSSPSPETHRDCRADGAQEAGGRSSYVSRAAAQVSGGAGRRLRPDLSLGPAGVEEAATAEGRGGAPRVPDPLYVHAPYLINVCSPRNNVRYGSRKILQQTCDAAEVGAAAVIVHAGHAEDGIEEGVGRWPRTLEMLESSVPILIENTAGGENAGAPLRCPRPALGSGLEEQVGDRDRVLPTPPRARRRGGARRRHRAGGGDRRQDRSASRERLARSTGNRSGPSREPRQGRDRRGGAPRDDQGGRPAGDRRNARRRRQMRADLDFVRSALVSR